MKVRKFIKDEQWRKLEPLLAGKVGDVGATGKDNRLFLEAVLWIVRTGSPWRDLPSELGNWHTTYTRLIRWGKSGRWHQILTALSGDRDLEMLMLNSTVVRARQHAAGAQKKLVRKRSAGRAAG